MTTTADRTGRRGRLIAAAALAAVLPIAGACSAAGNPAAESTTTTTTVDVTKTARPPALDYLSAYVLLEPAPGGKTAPVTVSINPDDQAAGRFEVTPRAGGAPIRLTPDYARWRGRTDAVVLSRSGAPDLTLDVDRAAPASVIDDRVTTGTVLYDPVLDETVTVSWPRTTPGWDVRILQDDSDCSGSGGTPPAPTCTVGIAVSPVESNATQGEK